MKGVDWAAQVRPLLRGHLAGPESRRESVDAVAASYGQLQLSEQPTNGIAYLRLLFSLADVPRELLVRSSFTHLSQEATQAYLPLYSTVLTEMATRLRDERALAQQIDLVTGGISSGTHRPLFVDAALPVSVRQRYFSVRLIILQMLMCGTPLSLGALLAPSCPSARIVCTAICRLPRRSCLRYAPWLWLEINTAPASGSCAFFLAD
jgi:hypothetical protein